MLNEIVNSNFCLGERIPKNWIFKKVIRSLLERFRPKVTTIEDPDQIEIEELAGSFQTYEMTLLQPKKNKSIALK